MTLDEFEKKYRYRDCGRDIPERCMWSSSGIEKKLQKYVDYLRLNSDIVQFSRINDSIFPRVELSAAHFFTNIGCEFKGITLKKDHFDLLEKDYSVWSFDAVGAYMSIICDNKPLTLSVYSRYALDEERDKYIPEKADDAIMYISLRFDGSIFSPTFIQISYGDKLFSPSGKRIDWDTLEDRSFEHIQRLESNYGHYYSNSEMYDLNAEAFGDTLDDSYENPYDW